MLYCKFAADLQNTFLEEYVWGNASVFYITYAGASNKSKILMTRFYNLQTRFCRLIKHFLKILWYNLQNNFLTGCCNWSIYYIFILISSQTIVCFNWVFVFPGPRPFAWPPTLTPGPGPKFTFTGPGPQFVFTGPGPWFVFTGSGTKFVFTSPGPQFLFIGSDYQFVFTQNLHLRA